MQQEGVMKFGIVPINVDVFAEPDMLVPFVQRAEALNEENLALPRSCRV